MSDEIDVIVSELSNQNQNNTKEAYNSNTNEDSLLAKKLSEAIANLSPQHRKDYEEELRNNKEFANNQKAKNKYSYQIRQLEKTQKQLDFVSKEKSKLEQIQREYEPIHKAFATEDVIEQIELIAKKRNLDADALIDEYLNRKTAKLYQEQDPNERRLAELEKKLAEKEALEQSNKQKQEELESQSQINEFLERSAKLSEQLLFQDSDKYEFTSQLNEDVLKEQLELVLSEEINALNYSEEEFIELANKLSDDTFYLSNVLPILLEKIESNIQTIMREEEERKSKIFSRFANTPGAAKSDLFSRNSRDNKMSRRQSTNPDDEWEKIIRELSQK